MIGFLFDNDGVLIDSSALHWKSWELLMQEDPSFFIDHASFVQGFGKRNDLILKESLPKSLPHQREKWADRKEELFRKIAQGTVELLPGMEQFLEQVKRAHIPRIIASSTPVENLKMYLSSTVLGDYFDQFISAEEVEHGKPAPDVFLAAAKRLKLSPKECVVFEDAPSGIVAGLAAGSFVVAIETTHPKKSLGGAHLIYSSPKELRLEEIIERHRQWLKKGG